MRKKMADFNAGMHYYIALYPCCCMNIKNIFLDK